MRIRDQRRELGNLHSWTQDEHTCGGEDHQQNSGNLLLDFFGFFPAAAAGPS